MRLEISREVVAWISAEAAETPEREVCGLLLGQGLHVTAALAAQNIAEMPETAFEIDPQALIAAHKAARAGGPAVVGHYHSHPNGRAEPSVRDAAAAKGGELWLIVAKGEVTAWLARQNQTFERLAL